MKDFTLLLKSLTCITASAMLFSCGDESNSTTTKATAGEVCVDNRDCQAGLFCIGTICRDPSASSDAGSSSDDTSASLDDTSSTTEEDSGIAPDTDTPPQDSGSVDSGTQPMDTSTEDSSATTRPEQLTGGVSIFEAKIIAGIFDLVRGNLGAAFVEPTDPVPPLQTIGPCEIFQAGATPPAAFGYDAGTISIEGTSPSVTLTPTGSGSITYPSPLAEDNQNIFSPNALITITGSGGEHVGAFSSTITAPNDHQVTSPQTDTTISGDTTVQWTDPDSDADILVNVVPLDIFFMPTSGNGLNCTVPADTGAFTIPAAAIDALSGPKLAITLIKARSQTLTVGLDTVILNVTYAHGTVVNLN